MFIVSPSTVWNKGALETRQVPRRIFGRVMLIPRRGFPVRLVWRMIFEAQILRFLAVLAPFVVAMLIWPQSAIAIAQAPILMIVAILFVESNVLRVPKERRAQIIDRAEADRGLDLLQVRGRAILTKIAARRQMTEGVLHLVVEQSDMAYISPLTFVSVQAEAGPEVIRLSRQEEALIRKGLFGPPLTERRLLKINLSENVFLRDVTLDMRGVSAHARLAALAS
ncbi:hypothetical protein LAZ40_20015 [Cereibacter sphaeroides]|uniref:hypothetical protein n=1 Tax=Rhodobacterales TaxID=204455 RepID=UPI000BBE43CD|nr:MULTISPECIES: hypothetical protein [Paracoccaceae]MCE6961319.1 hypothetical protein [Cereibacter sphaeroides]MCE6970305.1 hypothetical protein [Cereibacter sphaeroides]MCE6972067.1 hypothetical protein [Cereibacter sphaeroides]